MHARRRLDDLAARRDGVVGLADLPGIGVSPPTFRRWVAGGEVVRLAPGVGARRQVLDDPSALVRARCRLRAALVANGARAVLAGRSAAWAWGLCPRPEPLRVAIPHGARAGRVAGVAVVRAHRKLALEVDHRDGWPVVTVTRLLLDLARELDDLALLALAVDARRELGWDPRDALGTLAALPGMHGSARLDRVASRLVGTRPDGASEVLVREALERAGVATEPQPSWLDTPLGRFQVDVPLRGVPVGVECDSVAHHGSADDLERDHRKTNGLAAIGYRLVRISHRRAVAAPDEVVALVRAHLDQLGRSA